jgi:hypothetical protein
MWYVYDKRSTAIVKGCKTSAAAQAAITRAHNRYVRHSPYVPGGLAQKLVLLSWIALAYSQYYHLFIEQHVTKRNLITGTEFTQSVNTPLCCDPNSETHWSQ